MISQHTKTIRIDVVKVLHSTVKLVPIRPIGYTFP